MQRALPPRPNLDHLKSQAKDLLDAHRRRDREAFERIRSAVPAYANKSDDAIAASPFALHDAQSAIAREYGFVSWAALRANVSGPPKVASPPTPTVPNELVTAALEHRGVGADRPTPRTAPVLPLRNSVVMPGSLVPLDINRATSLRAIEAATQSDPQFIAIFAQRETTTESPTVDDLHPVGTLTILRASRQGDDRLSVVVEGVRWVALDELLQREPYYLASIIDAIDRGDTSSLADLDRTLRDRARRVADLLGADRENAHALIDATPDPIQLANVVMAHMQLPVADKAAFAAEPDATRRIEHAIAVLDEALRQGPS